MAKRRDRRPSATTHTSRPDSSDLPDSSASTPSRLPIPLHFFLLSLLLPFVALLVHRRHQSAPPTASSAALSVYERGLVKPDLDFKEILVESSRISANRSLRHFQRPVLAYVTPWNSRGYEMAKQFSSKFTHLSPVWYDLKSEGSKLFLEGRHNADLEWIFELRNNGNALLLPRIVLEAHPSEVLGRKSQQEKAIELIVTECREMGYDGIVLESWSRWAAYGVLQDKDARNMALQFIKQLGQTLHSMSSRENSDMHLQLIYVIPAPRSDSLRHYDFGLKDFNILNDDVDGYSLMTYDFSDLYHPGPNAPLGWIRSSIQIILGASNSNAGKYAQKIFLGINFYGNDYVLAKGLGGTAITGREYLTLLEEHRPTLQWNDDIGEHFFMYTANHVQHAVFYPSLMSISRRLDEARTWRCGISIWEIGQGLDYFFDLL